MIEANRFFKIARAYKVMAGQACDNLLAIKRARNSGAALNAALLEHFKSFDMHQFEALFRADEGGKQVSLLLGARNAQLQFFAILTEQIVNIHSQLNTTNITVRAKVWPEPAELWFRTLQDQLLDLMFLEKVFLFLDGRSRLPQPHEPSYAAIDALVDQHLQAFRNDLRSVLDALLDIPHANQSLQRYVFRAFDWVEEDAAGNGRIINNYFLPQRIWQPMVGKASALP